MNDDVCTLQDARFLLRGSERGENDLRLIELVCMCRANLPGACPFIFLMLVSMGFLY